MSVGKHFADMAQNTGGGIACATGSYCAAHGIGHFFSIENIQQFSIIAASATTAIYYGVTTYIAVRKWRAEKNAKPS